MNERTKNRRLFEKEDKLKIRQQALLEAVRFCGGLVSYSEQLKISRARASNWYNQPALNMPYEYAILTEALTQVSIERLSPFTEAANEEIRRLSLGEELSLIPVDLNEILIAEHFYYRGCDLERPIIIGTDRVLISGLAQIESHQSRELKKIPVIVLDLEALILEIRSIRDIERHFLFSERIALGLRLETKNKNKARIFRIIGFSDPASFELAKKIYFQCLPELIHLVDRKGISINEAAKIADLPKELQLNTLAQMKGEIR